ncbi:MAG TPA: chemotaxis response regulator protein-glutamate methylesterase [Candidimonas sp.]|nr:chemotaxis response regulator protein-glutamate methylesterase [Candidimonas sp.]
MRAKINVLIVDDSAVVRQVLTAVLKQDAGIDVVGAVADPIFAMQRMKKLWPDVIVLDVEMPRMDGITFLKKIMAERPTAVVICSSLTQKGAETSMQALAAGAVGVVAKPGIGGRRSNMEDAAGDLLHAVKAAGLANMKPRSAASAPAVSPPAGAMARTTQHVVAIGTSTGGTQALEVVLTGLPQMVTGIVIVQHMPEKFTAMFAQRLNDICAIEVREAKDGDRVMPGLALIAPGGRHMSLARNGSQYHVSVVDGPLVNRHRPSVDVLFRSVARCAGKNAVGVIMTGMGDDGARGLKEMRDAGARTFAQDEASCVVYGMPKEAVKVNAVDISLPLSDIAHAILTHAPVTI